MVHHSLILFMFFWIARASYAQDERYYRQIFSGELPKTEAAAEVISQFHVSGGNYRIDLNDDQMEESIEPAKIDGVDWLIIKSSANVPIYQVKLPAMGALGYIYKIKFVHLSKTVKALIVFLDEGRTTGRKFESTARFFVLSYENNDLSNISFAQGPHFFHEKEQQREQYWRRDYSVNVYDVDGDGVREIAVQYNHIQRFMKYVGKGIWERF